MYGDAADAVNIYELDLWTDLEDGIVRPGGLALTKRLMDLAKLQPGAAILDVGCGQGTAVAYLRTSGFDASGVDCSKKLIEQALSAHPYLPLMQADAEDLPFDGGFDGVLLECVLSDARAPRILAECHRILAPGGVLMVSDLYDKEPEGKSSVTFWHALMNEAGFQVLCFEDHTQALRDFVGRMLWESADFGGLYVCERYKALITPGYFALLACLYNTGEA